MVRWPQRIKSGRTSAEPVNGVDLLPTLCDVTGVDVPSDRKIDGASLVPLFDGKPVKRTAPLYWEKRWKQGPHVAMRKGDWKVLATYDQDHDGLKDYRLYNLREDISESTDLADAEPARRELLEETGYEAPDLARLIEDWLRAGEARGIMDRFQ